MDRIDKYVLIEVPDYLPEHSELKPGELYFSAEWHCVNFLCPCGCGIEVYLPVTLDWEKENEGRVWKFRKDEGGPTLNPSIQQTGHCQSHYNIINGESRWS